MLFLKAATPIQSIIIHMPPFALLATGLMIPSSAYINWEWQDLIVESDHFRGRIGFFFKNKNWMVIRPAPSYFFCWHASSNFVHGFPHCPVQVALMETFALQKSFKTEALSWLFKQDWTTGQTNLGLSIHFFPFSAQYRLPCLQLSLFCFWLCHLMSSCMPSNSNIFTQMWACHSCWLEWDVCTHICGQSMVPRQ